MQLLSPVYPQPQGSSSLYLHVAAILNLVFIIPMLVCELLGYISISVNIFSIF